jgi:hypothetical protein
MPETGYGRFCERNEMKSGGSHRGVLEATTSESIGQAAKNLWVRCGSQDVPLSRRSSRRWTVRHLPFCGPACFQEVPVAIITARGGSNA